MVKSDGALADPAGESRQLMPPAHPASPLLLRLPPSLAPGERRRRRRRRTGCRAGVRGDRGATASTRRSSASTALIARLPEFPPRAPDPRRPAARALAAAAHLRQRGEDRAAGEGRRPARRGARAAARAARAAGRRPRAALGAAAARRTRSTRWWWTRAARASTCSRTTAAGRASRRLLRHAGQERHRQDARGRPEDAARRLPRHRQPAAPEAHRLLRRRRLPDQLPERVGQAPGPQRLRHLAARHALGHLQPRRRARATAASCSPTPTSSGRPARAGRPHAGDHRRRGRMERRRRARGRAQRRSPRRIERWRADWESRDTERYLAHYSPRFPLRRPGPRGLGDAQAQGQRRQGSGSRSACRASHVPLPARARFRGRHLRPGLPLEQPVQHRCASASTGSRKTAAGKSSTRGQV